MTIRECKPIDWDKVEGIIKREKNLHYRIVYVLGFYTGYRIGDIVKLNWEDLIDEGEVKRYRSTREQKTKKIRVIELSDNAKRYIMQIYKELGSPPLDQPLIVCSRGTRKGARIKVNGLIKTFKMKMVKLGCDPQEQNTTHMMRKTWAYKLYLEGGADIMALAKVQRLLNHRDINTTIMYLGIDYTGLDEIIRNL